LWFRIPLFRWLGSGIRLFLLATQDEIDGRDHQNRQKRRGDQ
jgi:hypothetical protein